MTYVSYKKLYFTLLPNLTSPLFLTLRGSWSPSYNPAVALTPSHLTQRVLSIFPQLTFPCRALDLLHLTLWGYCVNSLRISPKNHNHYMYNALFYAKFKNVIFISKIEVILQLNYKCFIIVWAQFQLFLSFSLDGILTFMCNLF